MIRTKFWTQLMVVAMVMGLVSWGFATEEKKDAKEEAKAIKEAPKDTSARDAVKDKMREQMQDRMHRQKRLQECGTSCGQTCGGNMDAIAQAMTAVDEALKAVESGDKAAAKTQLAKVKELLTQVQGKIKAQMDMLPAVNLRCPITNEYIKGMDLPADQCTTYKGQKVGFCCPACKPGWDKLSDAEKEAKLKASIKEEKPRVIKVKSDEVKPAPAEEKK